MCRIEGWNVRTLRERIDSMLYERTALLKQPDALIRQELTILRRRADGPVFVGTAWPGRQPGQT
jgi:predicted nuclease of restriction endonuclease-like (RecB) superfamily